MKWLNEWEVASVRLKYRDHPVLGPATETLTNLVRWTNENSDGWPYWSKPARAAVRLSELIDGHDPWDYDRDDVTVAAYKAAIRPLKAFRTRVGADFEIVEVTS